MTFDMQKASKYADTGDLMKTTKWLYHALDEIDRQAKRIAELEAEKQLPCMCKPFVDLRDSQRKIIDRQRAALKKLGQAKRARGKALVEERARLYCRSTGAQWGQVGNIFKEEYRLIAREQLCQEGKL
jgi:hypothetical protein